MAGIRLPLFDSSVRTDPRPAKHAESSFGFLNRVAGDYWDHPREVLQQWFDNIADGEAYHDLRQRLRSQDDDQYRSGLLELYLHESLRRAGFEVTIHPETGSGRRPDFRAIRNGDVLYAEAVAPGTSAVAKAAARRQTGLLDGINHLGDPNFLLWIKRLEVGPDSAPVKQLRGQLRQWLGTLDPDDYADPHLSPVFEWSRNGWFVAIGVIPIRRDARGARGLDRSIGVYGHTTVGFIDDAPKIRDALASKHRAYGDLEAPFLIAVGTYMHDHDRWHSSNALYGSQAVQVASFQDGDLSSTLVRRRDGYFGAPGGWKHHNVSGVLLVNQLMPYSVLRADVSLWQHPAALRPLPKDLGLPYTSLSFTTDGLNETAPSLTPAEFYALPEDWPPGQAWS